MANETVVSQEVAEAEMLEAAASYAQVGTYAVLVLGKVTDRTTYPARDGRPSETVCKTVVSEGESWGLRFGDGVAQPGKGQRGAFIVSNIYKGKNGISADCLAFAAK